MSWVSPAALYFLIWWLVLFAMLPLGLRTQDEDQNVTLGTVPSAPKGAHMMKTVVRTTLVSLLIFGAFYGVTRGLGYSIDDIPNFIPKSG